MIVQRTSLVLGLLLTLCSLSVGAIDVNLSVDTTTQSLANGDVFIISLNAPAGTTDATVKVFDDKGALVRVLTGRRLGAEKIELPWNLKNDAKQLVKPGAYTIRVEAGWGLSLDPAFGKNGVLEGPPFVSLRDLAVDQAGNLYLLDAGAGILYKYKADGTPANDIATGHKIAAPAVPFWGSVAVGPDGRIYLAQAYTTGHIIDVYDGKTGERVQFIGGFMADDEKDQWKGWIAYPALVRLQDESRLYATSPGYELLNCYDPRQPGKTGARWSTRKLPIGDTGATNGRDAFYAASAYFTERSTLLKIVEQDGTAVTAYKTDEFFNTQANAVEKMKNIYGISFSSQGDLFLVLRGAGKVVKFIDNGQRLECLGSLGIKGTDAAKLEFITPAVTAVSPDGKALYIGEDGEKVSDKDATPGLARVTKYTITYAAAKQIQVTVAP